MADEPMTREYLSEALLQMSAQIQGYIDQRFEQTQGYIDQRLEKSEKTLLMHSDAQERRWIAEFERTEENLLNTVVEAVGRVQIRQKPTLDELERRVAALEDQLRRLGSNERPSA